MAITAVERHRGTSGDSGNWRVEYIVVDDAGSMTEFQAAEAVATEAPQELSDGVGGSLILVDVRVDQFFVNQTESYAIASAVYNPPEEGSRLRKDENRPVGEASYEFTYQAESEHLMYALQVHEYGVGAPSFGDKIKCRYEGPNIIHEGIDTPGASPTNTYRLSLPRGTVSLQYELFVESIMGSTNSTPFKGRPVGSVRFVQCNSTVSSGGGVTITWGFKYSPNRTGITIGSISGISIDGHSVYWVLDKKTPDPISKKIILEPLGVYVCRVFESADLNRLFQL